jgi:hypothetical protein
VSQALNIVQAIDRAVVAGRDARRDYLGPSVMGHECMRYVWLTFHWAKRPTFSGRILRLFARGHAEEDRIIYYLRKIGIEVDAVDPQTGKQFHYERHAGHMRGNKDGRVRHPVLLPPGTGNLEMKTFNKDSFRACWGVPHGTDEATTWPDALPVREAKPDHYAQMQSYMHMGTERWTLYIAVCKDNDDWYAEIVEYDEDYAKHIDSRGEEVIFQSDVPQKIRQDQSYMPCKTCTFSDICHGKEIPEKNCRTCAHSTPLREGNANWHCAKWDQDGIPEDVQQKGCEHHVFNPMLLVNIGDYIGGDSEKNYAEYRLPDGSTFKNGTRDPLDVTVIGSDELAAAPLPMTDLDKQFREQFSGASFVKKRKVDPEKQAELEAEAVLAKKQFTDRAEQKRKWRK